MKYFFLKRGKSHHCNTSNLVKNVIRIVLSLNKVSSLYYIPTLTRSLKHQPAQKAACTTSCKREPSVSRPADHRRVFFCPACAYVVTRIRPGTRGRVRVLTGGQGREARGPPTLLCAAINTESVGGEGRRGGGGVFSLASQTANHL